MRKWYASLFIVLLLLAGFALLLLSWRWPTPAAVVDVLPTATATPTHTPEPIIPTVTPPATAVAVQVATALVTEAQATILPTTAAPTPTADAPTATATEPIIPTVTSTAVADANAPSTNTPTATLPPTRAPQAAPTVQRPLAGAASGAIPHFSRFGVAGHLGTARAALEAGLPFGAFINWNVSVERPFAGIDFWQTIRLGENGIRRTSWEEIETAVAAAPGSFWVVGNEPDVRWQDNVTPQRYAEIYHDVYHFIKERDPSARLVIAGVSQATPLRRAYLDIVLDTYEARYGEPMPIDVWNVHAFVLREEADGWGVGIPPGMDGADGTLYEIEDHANLDVFRRNLIDFRAWMATRGYGDRPLVVSEYGILLPADYGFPPEVVAEFMLGTFDFFLTAANNTGYPADDGRLVQWWFWYSVYDDGLYPSGNLFDLPARQLTLIGSAWKAFLEG